MVYDLPAGGRRLVQRARGYAATVSGGVVVREHDEATGERPGRLLRGPPSRRPPAETDTVKPCRHLGRVAVA